MTDLDRAVELLQAGELVAIPTETVYGLAANGNDAHAVAKIFAAKNRPSFDPLILHFSDLDSLEGYVLNLPELASALLSKFSPGPLTLVLKKSDKVPDIVTSGMDKVAVRIPSHPITLQLLSRLNFPLAAPSANLFGKTSPTQPEHVQEQLGDKVSLILQGGVSEVGVESTILDLTGEEPLILRYGGLSQERIEDFLKTKIQAKTSSSKPSAPGMIEAHYSPGYPVKLMSDSNNLKLDEFTLDDAILNFSSYRSDFPRERQLILSKGGDLNEAASKLFASLRELGALKPKCIWAETVPHKGLGRAINDRLKRAAATSHPG